ncbi:hypothetical protein ES708_27322 [subsurface metagenome]
MNKEKPISFNSKMKNVSYFFQVLARDINEITFFNDLFNYAVSELDLKQLEIRKELASKKGESSLEGIILLHLANENHIKLMNQFNLTYLNTIFESYLFNIVRYQLLKHKGLLGKIEVSPEELYSLSTYKIIDKKIDKVTQNIIYGSYSRIVSNIDKKFGLKLNETINKEELEQLDDFKEARNIITHRKTKINLLTNQSSNLIKKTTFFEEEIVYYPEYIENFRKVIVKVAQKIDSFICEINPEL